MFSLFGGNFVLLRLKGLYMKGYETNIIIHYQIK